MPDLLVGVLVAAAVQVEVLPHPGPVSLLAAGVVLELALVRPPPHHVYTLAVTEALVSTKTRSPLRDDRQLLVPHHLPHVARLGLGAVTLLAPRHLRPARRQHQHMYHILQQICRLADISVSAGVCASLSSLCLSRIACCPAALSSRSTVLAAQASDGP